MMMMMMMIGGDGRNGSMRRVTMIMVLLMVMMMLGVEVMLSVFYLEIPWLKLIAFGGVGRGWLSSSIRCNIRKLFRYQIFLGWKYEIQGKINFRDKCSL